MSQHSGHSSHSNQQELQHQYQQQLEHPHQSEHPRSPTPESTNSQVYNIETASAAGYDNQDHDRHDHHDHYDHPNQEYPKYMEGHEDIHPQDVHSYEHEEVVSHSNTYADASEHLHRLPTRGELFRARVIGMATVLRLRIIWSLLALFGTMSWLSLMPAYAFRNKFEPGTFVNPSYTFFLVATVSTSITALWQSLCPFLIRYCQRTFWPRVINHSATQTTTIVVSSILIILNFFSWIFLAANKDGAKTNCHEGPLSDQSGYVAQCHGVNVAIVMDAIVFLLWTPIAMIIVCGTIERGFWWRRKRDNHERDMSQEEYDLKHPAHNGSLDNISQYDQSQTAKLAYVTPIASQFKGSDEEIRYENEEDYENHQQRQQQQQQQPQRQTSRRQQRSEPQNLRHKGSNTSLSGRLDGFFGAGWSSGPMPPPAPEPEPVPQPGTRPSGLREEHFKPSSEIPREQEPDKTSLNEDAYVTQWHNRRRDEWS
ncbi:hypothetical protein BGZ80_009599 [Entomortierella chlamydospora]|uniref:Uncharacterized protein n=1 Tax=Entomortierella chlamydospora TaxID=101097 RepID=A0A9P6N316_9FUNG|nr:hypothetical protein BGZ79_007857 [Entomortierella chlamydospora]KAG0023372.1 hypothetical protein BGZ80_009599 [Entomortierella chlamydospora]